MIFFKWLYLLTINMLLSVIVYILLLLLTLSLGIMDATNKEREYQLCLTRALLSAFSRENKAIENYICSDIVSRITSKVGHQSVSVLYVNLTSIPYLYNLFIKPGHGWIFNAFKSNKFVYFLPICWNVICCMLRPLLHP